MNKLLIGALSLVAGIAIGIGIFWLQSRQSPEPVASNLADTAYRTPEDGSNGDAAGEPSQEQLVDLAYQVAGYIQNRDYNALSQVAHPEYGVLFSPYATINVSTAQWFTASEIQNFGSNTNTYIWGTTAGSGEAIELTVSAYFDQYVSSGRDFTQAPVVGVNYIVRSGNALENVTEVFPEAQFVDFYFPPSDVENASTDWDVLRLVFELSGDQYYLSAIVHNEWTI